MGESGSAVPGYTGGGRKCAKADVVGVGTRLALADCMFNKSVLTSTIALAVATSTGCAVDVATDESQGALLSGDAGMSEILVECEQVMPMPSGDPPGQCLTDPQLGDFELAIDGDRVLLLTNDPRRSGSNRREQDVIVVDIDGQDGRRITGSPQLVATNYSGCYGYNGPEFLKPPESGIDLAILFPGASVPNTPPDGVHMVMRRTGHETFDRQLDSAGNLQAVTLSPGGDPRPSRLPSSPIGAYPDGSPADGQLGYAAFLSSDCPGKCFGLVNGGPASMTSMRSSALDNRLVYQASIGNPLDLSGTGVLVSACRGNTPPLTQCGLHKVNIDGAGGLVPQAGGETRDFIHLGDLGGPTEASAISTSVFSDPQTGERCAFFFVGENNGRDAGNDSIHVFRQCESDMTSAVAIAEVTQLRNGNGLGTVEHFRATTGNGQVVLHFMDRHGEHERDSFVVRVPLTATGSQSLRAQRLTEAGNGTEVVWLPHAVAPWSAAAYAQTAGRHAVSALAFDQAAELFAEAIKLGEHDEQTTRELRIELAEALMYAGRGPEAAATFVRAADNAPPAIRLDCQLHAADQWIITGHLDQGMAALASSLTEINEPAAATPRRALARVLWNRLRLRVRGIRYKQRTEDQIPPDTLRRLDVLRAVAHGLAMVDNIRGADFNGRLLLLALRTGEVRRLVGAMATEVVFLASQGGRTSKRARKLFEHMKQLAEDCPDQAFAQTWVLLADGAASFFEGRFRAAVDSLEKAEDIFADGPKGLTYERNNTRVFRVHALRLLGSLREHGALISKLVRTGRQRGDLYLETTLKLLHVQSRLALDDVNGAQLCIHDATWTPPEQGYHLQHWYELRARAELALYTGDSVAAAEKLGPRFDELNASMLLRVKLVRADAVALQARLQLAAALNTNSVETVRPQVARVVRALEKERVGYATVYALLLRAGMNGEDTDAVIADLRATIDHAEQSDMAMHRAAAQYALAGRVGGDEAASLRAAATRYAEDEGVVDLARLLELVAPGIAAAGD